MKAKIMIVDDEQTFRLLVKSTLNKSGHELTEVPDASSLRRAFNGPPPQLILLDLVLPDGDGLELLPEIKQRWPNTKVIILTGHGGPELAEKAYGMGDVLWLNKPFDAAMLNAMIDVALA